jgi:hypothetical protein
MRIIALVLVTVCLLVVPLAWSQGNVEQQVTAGKSVTIRTWGRVSMKSTPKGITEMRVTFPKRGLRGEAVAKDYTVTGAYDIVTNGVVHEIAANPSKLEVLSNEEFQHRSKGDVGKKVEGDCQFSNAGGFKTCLHQCTHYPGYQCLLHSAGNYCACEQ